MLGDKLQFQVLHVNYVMGVAAKKPMNCFQESQLVDDVLFKIFYLLPAMEIGSVCALVCKQW